MSLNIFDLKNYLPLIHFVVIELAVLSHFFKFYIIYRCSTWMNNSKRDFGDLSAEDVWKRKYRLCSEHFTDDQFNIVYADSTKRRSLKWDAIPTLFENQV